MIIKYIKKVILTYRIKELDDAIRNADSIKTYIKLEHHRLALVQKLNKLRKL